MKRCSSCRIAFPLAAMFCGMCGARLVAPIAKRRPRFRRPRVSKRVPIALALSLAIFGGVYGLASSLNVSTQTLGAGNTSVAACQAGTLTASYATSYSSSLTGYQVGVVTVSGLQSGCFSKAFKVALTNGSNTSLGEVTGTAPSSGTTFTADFTSSNVLAANVAGVNVTITG